MKKMLFAVLLSTCFLAISCTSQQRASYGGGATEITVPKGEKLINASWRGTHVWCLTRPMRKDEEPEIYTLQENSSFGIMQGKVTLKESK